MADLDYSAAGVPVRDDLRAAHDALWEHVRAPGTWWSGAERVAIVAESRTALQCALCRSRKVALSPNAVAGRHDAHGVLPEAAVEVIHRLRTDPGRLSRAWYEQIRTAGLSEGHYVELVALVAMTAGVDTFARALGIAAFALPTPEPGEPSRARPAGAKPNGAWVPALAAADAQGSEADLYGGAAAAPN